ncbi:chitinase class I [Mucilaginibacter frigoritolerans]|jgi:basic endochitinase B|uniref:Chitinase class I n=1 Tax=Mucilaginibacter frigoritolerans TaxID=652788 RepID=A0A562UG00_9SPHI|nr:chitinase [Mucilaginibacter frigoritolerans]TWJ04766.1 chitinase class I [Mucilaginibacter frigoritolerans]
MKSIPFILRSGLILLNSFLLFSVSCYSNSNAQSVSPAHKTEISGLLSEKQFNDLFPMRDKFYTYTAFIRAVKELGLIKVKVVRRAVSVYQFTRTDKRTGKAVIIRQDEDWNEDWAKKKPDSSYVIDFGNFCSEKDITTNKKELAAFFANIAHETRHGEDGKYNDGLMFIHENNTSLPYVAPNDVYPAVAGKKYYGRGPMQLSYNGNYGYASDCIFGDKAVLLNNPGLVETDPVVAFETAIYFWMTPQTYKPSAHDVMAGKWVPKATDKAAGRTPGFGMTINIINGQVECGKGNNVYGMNNRIAFYQYFLKKLGVSDPNCACSCGNMKSY